MRVSCFVVSLAVSTILNPASAVDTLDLQALVACTEASEAMLRKEMASDSANLKDGSY